MSLMKFVGEPELAVQNFISGLKLAFPSFSIDLAERIVINNQINGKQVCLLSGGGSGHEPFSLGFVGKGMCSGAVAGTVFASPPAGTILDAICTLKDMNDNNGVLVIHLNYTGDVLNFGFAVEHARALHNVKIDIVVVDDDVSRSGEQISRAGKRGLCGGCFVMKIAGSMAEKGEPLEKIAQECRVIKTKVATNGAAVTACTLPGQKPLFKIEDDEIDFGLGIHGEAGIFRTKLMPIGELVEKMLNQIIDALNLCDGNCVCVIVNNLGTVSTLEMGVISHTVGDNLAKRNIKIVRLYFGSFVTSLDMAGFQISLLNITDNYYWVEHLDRETNAPGWHGSLHSVPLPDSFNPVKVARCESERIRKVGPKFSTAEQKLFEKCLKNIATDLLNAESKLNQLDSIIGDGDSGTTLAYLCHGVINNLTNLKFEYPATVFSDIGQISMKEMGGTSGALYGILFTAASQEMVADEAHVDWVRIGSAAIKTMLKYSVAEIGDRTMVDALLPAFKKFEEVRSNGGDATKACEAALQIAKEKCEETKHMKPRLGRASYVPAEYVTNVDPGAYAVTIWLNAICVTLR